MTAVAIWIAQVQATPPPEDFDAERILIALLAAVLGFAVRAAWEAFKERKTEKTRAKRLLSAMLIEIRELRSQTQAVKAIADEEWDGPPTGEPMPFLNASLYGLVREHPPRALVDHPTALTDLIRIQSRTEYVNVVIDMRRAFMAQTGFGAAVGASRFSEMLPGPCKSVLDRLDSIEQVVQDALTG